MAHYKISNRVSHLLIFLSVSIRISEEIQDPTWVFAAKKQFVLFHLTIGGSPI